jgi:hypothetical protein
MPKSNLRIVPPATENGTVLAMQPPRRPPNRELREREHLTDAEVEQLVEAARGNRWTKLQLARPVLPRRSVWEGDSPKRVW